MMRTRYGFGWLLVVLAVGLVPLADSGQAADGRSPVAEAAKAGDLDAVRSLISNRADVNLSERDGSTALLWAAYHGDVEMVRTLTAAGAAPDAANRYGVTPLLQASRIGATAVIEALLDAGADPSLAHPEGETPLMAVSRAGNRDAVRLLLERGADVNSADLFQQQTALMWAAAEGHADVVKMLLEVGADADLRARITSLTDRKHADHPTGGFTALMFAVRNGHEDVARALLEAGADPMLTNGDGVTATAIAIVNDRFDLAKMLVDLGADPNDGSLYFAVDMHDATTDMRARDGSRLRTDYPNTLSALDLIEFLLEHGADPNKPFVGRIHNTTLCCDSEINASPFFRAAVAADVEALKVLLAYGAQIDWSPTEVKKEEGAGGRGNPNVGKTPTMMALNGGKGAAFAAGPGFGRLDAPPFREASNREPLDAIKVLLAAGADPNAAPPDGGSLLHQAVAARQVAIIRELAAAGARFDAVDKDNLTALQLAEKPEPPPPPGNNNDERTYRRPQDTREDVIAAVRELMGLGPDDPTPQPPPAPDAADSDDSDDSDASDASDASTASADDSPAGDQATDEAAADQVAQSVDRQAETRVEAAR